MLDLEDFSREIKEDLGLSVVYVVKDSMINTTDYNYGYIRPANIDVHEYDYELDEEEPCNSYSVSAQLVLVVDLIRCNADHHRQIVEYMMSKDCVVVTNSSSDAQKIFEEQTGSDNLWESDNALYAVWFTYTEDVNNCNKNNGSWCIV